MQYWNQLDKFEDEDEEQAEESTLGEVQSDFDGASEGSIRETNPNQQYFDFGEQLNPPLINEIDRMSGYQEMQPEEPTGGPPGVAEPNDGRRAENDLGGRNPINREGQ